MAPPLAQPRGGHVFIIGIDPHKGSHTAAVLPFGSITTSRRVPHDVPANAAVSISVRLSTVGNALRFASVVPCPSSTRTACADAMPKSMPTRRLSFMPSRRLFPHRPARPSSDVAGGHGPNDAAPTAAPTHVLQPGPSSNGADPLPSCGASVAGTSVTIRLTRPDPRASPSAVLNATTRTSRDDNPTPGPRPRGGSPVPVLLICAAFARACAQVCGWRAAYATRSLVVRARRVYVTAVAAHSRPQIRNNGDHKARSHRAVWVSAPDVPEAICCTSPRIDNIARSTTMNVASGHSAHRTSHTGSHRRGRTVARANKTPATASTTLTASATTNHVGAVCDRTLSIISCESGAMDHKGSAAEHPVGLE